MRIGFKLAFAFFGIAVMASCTIGFIAYERSKAALEQETFNKLTVVREMKGAQIEDFHQLVKDQVQSYAHNPMVVAATKAFRDGYRKVPYQLGITDSENDLLRRRLRAYYTKAYLPRMKQFGIATQELEEELPDETAAELLQQLYIVDNPNPVGEKHRYDNALDGSDYSNAHATYHPAIRSFLERFGYYDIFLVDDSTGRVLYTVYKEVDFCGSLTSGPLKNSNIARAFEAVKKSPDKNAVQLVDYAPYRPSYNEPAAFIACPVYDVNERIGILIFQMPVERINAIMTSNQEWEKVGLGKTGETYIVGDDFKLRTQSRFFIDDSAGYFATLGKTGTSDSILKCIRTYQSAIGLQEVRTRGSQDALGGKTGTQLFPDYRGVNVLSAYRPLKIAGMHWALMSEIDESEAFAHVQRLRNYILTGFGLLLLFIAIASWFISRKIVSPLRELTVDAQEIAKGNFTVEITHSSKDEIGVLAASFRKMQLSIRKLVGDLQESNHTLESKVIERTQEINLQKEMVEEKNREMRDSINYALRLQHALMPPFSVVKELFTDAFIVFKPKDVISGDFFWMQQVEREVLIAVADCTGHGVPGALVSVVGANSLNRCIREFKLTQPGAILDKLTDLVIETFENERHEVSDGMDISLVKINLDTLEAEWAGANNGLWIIRAASSSMEELRADKQPIGSYFARKSFTNHSVKLEKGDCIYLFSDGYSDQFGGPKGKKMKYKVFQELVASMHRLPLDEQGQKLSTHFDDWRGELEQIDDVCVIGIKI